MATICTPHERMFLHLRKSSNGVTMPTWLRPGLVYVKHHLRNKGDLLVDEAKLIEANPQYARVRFNNGRETTVSLRDLAPHPRQVNGDCNDLNKTSIENTETRDCAQSDFLPSTSDEPLNNDEPSEATNTSPGETQPPLHRSSRLRDLLFIMEYSSVFCDVLLVKNYSTGVNVGILSFC